VVQEVVLEEGAVGIEVAGVEEEEEEEEVSVVIEVEEVSQNAEKERLVKGRRKIGREGGRIASGIRIRPFPLFFS